MDEFKQYLCYKHCKWEWTNENILKCYETDVFGGFFQCKVDISKLEYIPCGACYIDNSEMLFTILKKRYDILSKERKIQSVRVKHKYTIDKYLGV